MCRQKNIFDQSFLPNQNTYAENLSLKLFEKRMKELINNFPEQLQDAIRIGKTIPKVNKKIENVIIAGMGGSGIGGKINSLLLADTSQVCILANSNYDLPLFASKNTLLVISSYSGNTEETIEVLKKGIKRGCEIACITSGGRIEELAKEHQLTTALIPGGNPPRSMFAYSFVQQLYVLRAYGVIDDFFEQDLENSITLLTTEKQNLQRLAQNFAEKLQNRIPVIYSDSWLEGVTKRWCQQINENSKMLCWNNVFPEMNHNELVGWETADNRTGYVLIRSPFDHPRSQLRMDICLPIFQSKNDTILEFNAKGNSKIEATIYTVVFGDWLSWYLSELSGVDATEIKNIIHLKNALASV